MIHLLLSIIELHIINLIISISNIFKKQTEEERSISCYKLYFKWLKLTFRKEYLMGYIGFHLSNLVEYIMNENLSSTLLDDDIILKSLDDEIKNQIVRQLKWQIATGSVSGKIII